MLSDDMGCMTSEPSPANSSPLHNSRYPMDDSDLVRSLTNTKIRLLPIRPNFKPPETLAAHTKQRVDTALGTRFYTHIAIIDRDVTVPDRFYHLAEKWPHADLITVLVDPSSLLMRIWELTYRVKLAERLRGCAVIYNTCFLERVGGWPLVETPDTWLLSRAKITILDDSVHAVHHQDLDLKHSINSQLRDGRSRAELGYPFWKTLLHSIFRLRPLVLIGYLKRVLDQK